MFRRFLRREAELPIEFDAPEVADTNLEMQAIDPDVFIVTHEKDLLASAASWSEIAKKARENEPDHAEHVRAGLVAVWQANRSGPLPDDTVIDRETNKLTSELSVYSLVTARRFSMDGVGMGLSGKIKEHFLKIPDHTVNYIIRSADFPTRRFLVRQLGLVTAMAEADDRAAEVLNGLTSTYASQPADLKTMAEMYEDGAANYDSRYRELQQMINTDWHSPNPDRSILRTFCKTLTERPDAFVADFARTISEAESNRRMVTARNMARFAIIAKNGADPVTTTAIRQMLMTTYSRWHEFEELDALFASHIDTEVTAITRQLDTIAGPRNTRNIRTYPTDDQVDRLKEHFGARHTPDRTSRRSAARKAERTHGASRLPSAGDIDQAAETLVKPDKPRKLVVAEAGHDGLIFAEVSVPDLIKRLRLGPDKRYTEDVKTVVTWLQANPINNASRKLRGQVSTLRSSADSKPIELRRFAPEKSSAVRVHGDNRYMRVVYGLVGGDAIVIIDVLSHDEFDKKYPTK